MKVTSNWMAPPGLLLAGLLTAAGCAELNKPGEAEPNSTETAAVVSEEDVVVEETAPADMPAEEPETSEAPPEPELDLPKEPAPEKPVPEEPAPEESAKKEAMPKEKPAEEKPAEKKPAKEVAV